MQPTTRPLSDDDAISDDDLARDVAAVRSRALRAAQTMPTQCSDCGLELGHIASPADGHTLFVLHRRSGECAREQQRSGHRRIVAPLGMNREQRRAWARQQRVRHG